MGVGHPLEAAYELPGAVPAGTWRLIGDGVVFDAADLRFDVIWRARQVDTLIATFRHHFDPPPDGPDRFSPVPYDGEVLGIAASASPGDQLVLRFAVESLHAAGSNQYAPNGDGSSAMGRIPSLRLP